MHTDLPRNSALLSLLAFPYLFCVTLFFYLSLSLASPTLFLLTLLFLLLFIVVFFSLPDRE